VATYGAPTGQAHTPTGPYHSPYQSSQAGQTQSNATADARNNPAYGGSSYGGNAGASTTTAPQSGNSGQYGASNSSDPYANPDTPGPYPGYQQPASYQQTAPSDAAAPQPWNGDQGAAYPTTSAAPQEATPAASTGLAPASSSGEYRPGTTGRNAAALSGQTGAASDSAYPATGSSYPTTGSQYPAASGAAPALPSQYPSY